MSGAHKTALAFLQHVVKEDKAPGPQHGTGKAPMACLNHGARPPGLRRARKDAHIISGLAKECGKEKFASGRKCQMFWCGLSEPAKATARRAPERTFIYLFDVKNVMV